MEKNKASLIQGEMVINLLHHLDTHRSMRLDGIHPRAQRELVEGLTKPLSIISQQFWLTREVPRPRKWRLANGQLVYRKGQREDPGNYRFVSLTCLLGKITELIILDKKLAG